MYDTLMVLAFVFEGRDYVNTGLTYDKTSPAWWRNPKCLQSAGGRDVNFARLVRELQVSHRL